MISKIVGIICGWCDKKSSIETWEDTTYAECTSREQRRAYTSLYNEKAFLRKTDTFYKCPHCGMWSRGCQLTITDTDDEKLLKLGREPVINENIQNKDLGATR